MVDGGFNASFRISRTINIGDKKITLPSVKGVKLSTLYTLIDPISNREEEFFVERIDEVNKCIEIRMAENGRPLSPEQNTGFKYCYLINNQRNDPYISWWSPGGIASSPILSGPDNVKIVIPHEMLHKSPHFLKDLDRNENNIMSCTSTSSSVIKPLRYFELQPVETGCGLPVGQKQCQWLLIKRN